MMVLVAFMTRSLWNQQPKDEVTQLVLRRTGNLRLVFRNRELTKGTVSGLLAECNGDKILKFGEENASL